jgi:energy-coupling factor transporter ATP-binding protein EcfA2
MSVAAGPPTNPYVGPRPFQTGERLFGRDEQINQLTRQLIEQHILLLLGPNGAGKTSLVQAGLIPSMQAEGFLVLPVIRFSFPEAGQKLQQPGNPFVVNTLRSLDSVFPEEKRLAETQYSFLALPGYLRAYFERLSPADRNYPTQKSTTASGDNKYLIIFDQFEELLTLNQSDREDKIEFCQQLGAAFDNPSLWALFALREEYLTPLEPYQDRLLLRIENRFQLEPLTPEQAYESIVRPAELAGVRFDPQAAGYLIDQLGASKQPRQEAL